MAVPQGAITDLLDGKTGKGFLAPSALSSKEVAFACGTFSRGRVSPTSSARSARRRPFDRHVSITSDS